VRLAESIFFFGEKKWIMVAIDMTGFKGKAYAA
jgi:hypothetical protein